MGATDSNLEVVPLGNDAVNPLKHHPLTVITTYLHMERCKHRADIVFSETYPNSGQTLHRQPL